MLRLTLLEVIQQQRLYYKFNTWAFNYIISDFKMKEPPFVIFDRDPNGTVVGYKGYCYEIVRILQQQYNFT